MSNPRKDTQMPAKTSAPRTGWTLAIVSIALFMTALDNLVVGVALPSIRVDLGGSIESLEWTVNAYTLTFAVLLITGAALGDRFGRKRMSSSGWGSSPQRAPSRRLLPASTR
jgi:MFS family permease